VCDSDNRKTHPGEALGLVALCALGAVHVLLLSAAFPFFNNVDENAHVDLVNKYARGYWPSRPAELYDPASVRDFSLYGTFEYLNPPVPDTPYPPPTWTLEPELKSRVLRARESRWVGTVNHEAHSPPTYYVVVAAWRAIGRGLGLDGGTLLYFLRFLNAALMAATIACAYRFCRDAWPGRPEIRLGVPMLLAFLPQDLFYSVNSDVLSPLLFCLSLMMLLRWLQLDPPGALRSLATGLLVAATFLVKYTNVGIVVILVAAVLLTVRRLGAAGRWREAWAPAATLLGAAGAPVLLVFVRNRILFGDMTGAWAKVQFLGWTRHSLGEFVSHPVFTPAGFWTLWDGTLRTLWRGEFVWHLERIASPAADLFYVASSTLLLIAAAVRWHSDSRRRGAPNHDRCTPGQRMAWASVLLGLATLVALSASFDYGNCRFPSEEQPYFTAGRLVAGALIPFLALYVDGAALLLRPFSRVVGPLVFVGLTQLVQPVGRHDRSSGERKRFRHPSELLRRLIDVNCPLGVQPELRCHSECCGQLERHFRTDGRTSVHDPIDDLHVATNVIGKALLGHAQRLQELLVQDLTGGGRLSLNPHGVCSYPRHTVSRYAMPGVHAGDLPLRAEAPPAAAATISPPAQRANMRASRDGRRPDWDNSQENRESDVMKVHQKDTLGATPFPK